MVNTQDMENTADNELLHAVRAILATAPHKIIISNRRHKNAATADLKEARLLENSSGSSSDRQRIYEKIIITPRDIRGKSMYQAEQLTRTQAFHLNMQEEHLEDYITMLLSEEFRQLDSFSDSAEGNIKISKKGKVMSGIRSHTRSSGRTEADNVSAAGTRVKSVPLPSSSGNRNSHDRRKRRLIEEGTLVPPLVDMGIFTKDGRVVHGMSNKFKQINRFLEIIDDAVEACGFERLTIVDFGCGKAYLTFIIYYYLTYIKKIKAVIIGLDLKADVIADCNHAAIKYGYDDLHFEVGDISSYTSDAPIDMVITLHACDTATDYALYNAIKWNSRLILSVPCCQHELNSQIKNDDASLLTKYGIIKERFASLATDALRASLLEYKGYKTQVLEFVDLSHTPKNLLIRAVRTNISNAKKEHSLDEVRKFISDFNADPTLYRLLTED